MNNHYKLIVADLSIQTKLNAAIQQTELVGQLKNTDGKNLMVHNLCLF